MRALLTAFAAAILLPSTFAQGRSGTYQPKNGSPIPWSVNENNALLWNGSPYLPVGLCIDGTAADVERVRGIGIRDVIADVPANGITWEETLAAMDKGGMSYLLRINSLAPMANGVAVEPQGYRVVNLMGNERLEISLPGCQSAYAVLVTRRDASVVKHERLAVPNGKLSYAVPQLNGMEHVLLVYPLMASLELPDFWEGLDVQRDVLLAALRRNPLGPGLRGIVNPMGRLLTMPGQQSRFVPTTPYFRYELRDFLEKKYRNIETAQRAWQINAIDFETFDAMSNLVPLWFGSRGIPQFWDITSDRLYSADSRRSSAWKDIHEVIATAGAKRFQRLVTAIQAVANVPVVQEWAGWSAPYEMSNPAVTGIGMRSLGSTPLAVAESASRATSSILRWNNSGWLVATDVDLGPTAQAGVLTNVLDDLTSLGARGFFVRTADPATIQAAVAENARRSADAGPAGTKPRAVFYPENARNPAMTQRLAGGSWWLPSPASGNRIDLGTKFFAYRLEDAGNNFVAMLALTVPQRVRLRLADPKGAKVVATDGSDPDPKIVKGALEVTMGQAPILFLGAVDVPIPEDAKVEAVGELDLLLKITDGPNQIGDEVFLFKDAALNFDKTPGASFAIMVQQLNRTRSRIGRVAWIEAETSRDTTFSDIQTIPGASNGSVLVLDTKLGPPAAGYYAVLDIPVRSLEDQEVWISARIPEHRRADFKAVIGRQVMTISGEGISPYGAGFAWYKLGNTRLSGSNAKLRLQMEAPDGADIAIDTVVFYPGSFRPNGVSIPVAYGR